MSKSSRKIFILDTNVILFDPYSIFKFEEHEVVIPIVVFEEVDRFKRDMSENGRNARMFSRYIDELRNQGKISEGVQLKNGGLLKVELGNTPNNLPNNLDLNKADNQMLSVGMVLVEARPECEVCFISKDINLRIKADAVGLKAADYKPSKYSHKEENEAYTGTSTIELAGDEIDKLYSNKKIEIPDRHFYPNEFVFLKDETSANHTAIGRFDLKQNAVVPVYKPMDGLWGIYPRNAEQTFAIDLLMNDEIKLVSLVGKAGTGKTLLALAAGLSKTVDDGIYSRLLVSRPVMPMGRDIGYLPGSVEEKLHPYMQPIFDNVEYLFGASSFAKSHRRGVGKGCHELMEQGLLNIEPLTYIRGRSIPQQFIIVDEAQNLSPHEMKTIMTRAGENTKIVITGDTFQIDSPYLDSLNNGLAYVMDCFKNEAIAGHVTLTKGERSRLSELATELMK